LSIPSKVIEVNEDKTVCKVDTMGVVREASLLMMADEGVEVGDYVLLHIGFVMEKIDEKAALEAIETYKELLEAMDEEERKQAILEGDNCPNI
jgi:hydrogenase expression/formation protein HypC